MNGVNSVQNKPHLVTLTLPISYKHRHGTEIKESLSFVFNTAYQYLFKLSYSKSKPEIFATNQMAHTKRIVKERNQ